jgi:hypothetical protein
MNMGRRSMTIRWVEAAGSGNTRKHFVTRTNYFLTPQFWNLGERNVVERGRDAQTTWVGVLDPLSTVQLWANHFLSFLNLSLGWDKRKVNKLVMDSLRSSSGTSVI